MRSTDVYLAVVFLSALLVASCTTTKPVSPATLPSATAGQVAYPHDLQGAQLFRIDAKTSSVRILVYRGGTMAKMGHNHVMSSTNLAGYVWRHATLQGSGFNIVVPVNEIIVDDDNLRVTEGADFPLNVTAEAKHGTRENMLSEPLLDAVHFPYITIKSITMSGAIDTPQVIASIQIKNQTHEMAVPVALVTRDNTLEVRGEFELKQSEFGITPFSVAMGALYVLDTIKVKFDLVALRVEP